jgi:hypothetical protein
MFSPPENGDVPEAQDEDVRRRLADVQFEEETVAKKIKQLKTASAPGPDGIGSLLLKELSDHVTGPLTTIYRTSLDSGGVPENWRRSNITPIYKKGSKADPANYRPVSLTSICCRLFESILRDGKVEHMKENGLVEDSQHGFVKGRSCATNLVEFFDLVSATLDGGGAAAAVFLDFAKAFDKVPAKRLLEKLRSIGTGGNVLQWI